MRLSLAKVADGTDLDPDSLSALRLARVAVPGPLQGLPVTPSAGRNGIANELGFPIVFMDSRLKGGIVGETGRNLSRLRELLIAYAPVVAFWDEIDLLLGRSTDWNGDSGASNEVRQAALTLLQDAPRLGIFVIASSNNPLSALQFRVRNRVQLVPVLHPAADDAVEIARREGAARDVTLAEDAADLIRDAGDVLWNGRDIARMITSARSNVLRLDPGRARAGHVELTAADLRLLVRHLAAARDEATILNALEAVYVVDNPAPAFTGNRRGRPGPGVGKPSAGSPPVMTARPWQRAIAA